jgi:hypothetical protein
MHLKLERLLDTKGKIALSFLACGNFPFWIRETIYGRKKPLSSV